MHPSPSRVSRALRVTPARRLGVVLLGFTVALVELAAQIPPRAPTFVRHPEAKHAAIGESGSVQFEVGADAWPAAKYEWFKDGAPLPGRTNSVLDLRDFTMAMGGTYTARAYNDHGSVMSNGATLTIHDLQITRLPQSQTVAAGATVTFAMEVFSTDPVTYEWHGPNGRIPTATGPSLTLSNVQPQDAGRYYGYVASTYGQRHTGDLTLTVNSAPVFLRAPENTSTAAGSRAVLNGHALGSEPFSYVWRKNGSVIAGATGNQLIFDPAQRSDEGSYSVTISNAFGSITSAPATLRVVAITLSGPREKVYDGQPLTLSATTDPAGLNVEYRYTSSNGFSLGGPPVQPGFYRIIASVQDNPYYGIASADVRILPVTTAPTILGLHQVYDGQPKLIRASVPNGAGIWAEYVNSPLPVDAGVYRFRLRLADGSRLSLSGPAEYLQIVEKAPQALSFAALPATLSLGTAFSVAATSTAGLPVALSLVSGNATLNGTQLTLHDNAPVTLRASQAGDRNHHPATETLVVSAARQTQAISFAALPDRLLSTTPIALNATSSSGLPVSFEIAGGPATISGGSLVFTGYAGVVHVRAIQAGDATFNAATSVVRTFSVLTAQRPFITAQPVSRAVQLDQTVTLSIGATAPGPLSYVWFKDGRPFNWGPAATSSFTFSRARPETAGVYSVAVFHGTSWTVTTAATITVLPMPSPDVVVPVITNQPTAVSYALGEKMALSVSHTSWGMYQWFKDGQPLWDGREWRYEGHVREIAGQKFLPGDAGIYHVVITNSAGSASSAPIAVSTSSDEPSYVPPVVSAVAHETYAQVGGSIRLFVTAHGSNLNYTWNKDGTTITGATANELTIANAQPADAGRYGVTIRRGSGTDSGSLSGWGFDVAVLSGSERGTAFAETPPPGPPDGSGSTGIAPTIVARPLDGGYDPGTRVVLSVTAEGTAPLSYQWRRENVLITGATASTLVFDSIQSSDAGYYTVEVTNPFGQAAATGRLQVSSGPPTNTPPAITRAPTAQTVVVGETAIFTVDVTGAQPLSFQWRKNGVPISDGHSRILTLYNVQPGAAGNYEVAIVNPHGAVTSTPVALTVTPVAPPPPPSSGTWLAQDIGGATPAGSAADASGVVTLEAAGADIWDVSDAFHFRYQSLTGDGEIVARVTQLENTHAWAKAGVMIRESLEPGARNVLAMVNAGFVAHLQSRNAPNGATTLGAGHWVSAPRWLRLVRSGNTLAGFHSANGTAWTSLGSVTLTLPATIYLGLAATSHANGTLATAVFDQVAISGVTSPPPPPPGPAPLPAPTSLVATTLSSSAVNLAWVDQSTDETGFELQRSTDGTNFTTFLSVGAGVTSSASSGLAASTTYSFRVRAVRGTTTSAFTNVATAATLPTAAPPAPPAGTWQSGDIGGVAATGSASESGGVFTVVGSGSDIWESGDEFRFRHQPWSGDGELIVRVTGLTNTHGWAKAGLMFREDLSASARHVFLCFTPGFGVNLQRRLTTAGASDSLSGSGTTATPRWLRLVRAGSTFTGYESANGTTWSLVGTTTVALPASVFVGLAVTSHNDGALATATFDNLTLNGGGTPPPPPATLAAPSNLSATANSSTAVALTWLDNASSETGYEVERSTDNTTFVSAGTTAANATSFTASGLSAVTTYYFRVRAVQGSTTSLYSTAAVATTFAPPLPTQPGSWSTTDIGAVATAGSASESGGVVTLHGSGADIWDNADEFRYRYQSLAGDGEIVARLTGLTNTHSWAKAGLMLRESLTAGSRHAFVCLTPGNGVAFQRRLATSGATEGSSGTNSSALPRWLRLVRSGATVSAFESANGTFWTPIGTATFSWSGSLHIGLAVTSHNDGTLATATFDNVTVTNGTTPGSTGPSTPPPSTTLAAPSNLVATAVSGSQVNLTWNDNSTNETEFRLERSTDNVTFTLLPPSNTPANSTSFSNTGLTAGTTYYYRIRALGTNNTLSGYSNTTSVTTSAPPSPPPTTAWSNTDVGAVGIAGSIDIGTTSITVRGSGADIWDNADAFRFLYRTLPGDCVVEAQVASLTNTHGWAKAGVMIRESLAPGARNVFIALTPGNGIGVQQRQIAGQQTYFTPGPWGAAAPYWVRLVRTGTQIAAYVSTNGTTWTQLQVVSFPTGSALVGFAVTSHNNAQLNTAVFNEPFIQ